MEFHAPREGTPCNIEQCRWQADLSWRGALKEGFLLNYAESVWKPQRWQIAVRESTSHDLRDPCA